MVQWEIVVVDDAAVAVAAAVVSSSPTLSYFLHSIRISSSGIPIQAAIVYVSRSHFVQITVPEYCVYIVSCESNAGDRSSWRIEWLVGVA